MVEVDSDLAVSFRQSTYLIGTPNLPVYYKNLLVVTHAPH
jgi:hypothetical protein